MSKKIVIKQVLGRVYDVFFGEEGWEPNEHTRFVVVGKDFVKYLSGANMPPDVLRYVIKEFQ